MLAWNRSGLIIPRTAGEALPSLDLRQFPSCVGEGQRSRNVTHPDAELSSETAQHGGLARDDYVPKGRGDGCEFDCLRYLATLILDRARLLKHDLFGSQVRNAFGVIRRGHTVYRYQRFVLGVRSG